MKHQPRFIKKRLNQIIAMTLLSGVGLAAHAGEFSLTNNQISLSVGGNLYVDETGIADGAELALGAGLPNISFGLNATGSEDGDYFVRLRMNIDSQSNNNSLTMSSLGVVRVTVAGGVVTNAAMVTTGQSNYQPISVSGTKQINSGSLNVSGTFTARSTMLSFAGGTITLEVNAILAHLINNNALFDDIIGGFLVEDHYDYSIRVQPLTGPTNLVLGHDEGGTFTAFPRQDCASYTVIGTFSVGLDEEDANQPSAIVESCGGGDDEEEEEEEDLIDEETINELNEEAAALEAALEQELAAGTVSESTVTQTTSLTSNAANLAQTLANSAASGEPINVNNAFSALSAATGAASVGGKVAAAAGATGQQALLNQNLQILTGTANVINALATQGASLNNAQTIQLKNIVSNSMNTLSSLSQTSSSSPADLAALARQANSLTQAKAKLNIPATQEESAQVEEISRVLVTAVINKVLTGANGSAPTDEEIADLLQSDPELFSAVLEASLDLPPTSTEPPAVAQARIEDAFRSRFPTADITTVPSFSPVPPGGTYVFGGAEYAPSEVVGFVFGNPNAGNLALSVNRQVQALSASDVNVVSDPVTGVLSITLPGESYSGVLTAIKSVPTSVPTGITFLRDGRVVLVRNGYAAELAPTSVDGLAFTAATLNAGYSPTFRTANGTFSLDLGGTQRFSGAFAYDNLTGKNLADCGNISFAAPTGAINSAAYAFVANCSNGGISQRITPFIDNADFFASVGGFGYTTSVDRTSGFITVTGVGRFKPSFFVDTRTSADTAYYEANKDGFNMAYQGGDFNGDGVLDFKVISASGVQLLYGVK